MDTHSPVDFEPPPPAYNVSQQELDQKVSYAIEHSLTDSLPAVDEHGFPVYDAAAFEAVASSYETAGAGSSVVPEEGSQRAYAVPGDVKLSITTSSTKAFCDKGDGSDVESVRSRSLGDSAGRNARRYSPEIGQYYRSSPPPAFASVGSPPGSTTTGPLQEDIVRLLYRPDSRAPSPLSSPPSTSRDLTMRPQSPHLPARLPRQAADTPPTRRRIPRHSIGSQALMTSRLDFNPSLAYNKHESDLADDSSMTSSADPTAFYNHAVAYHLTGGSSNASAANRPAIRSDSPYHVPRQPPPMPSQTSVTGDTSYQSSAHSTQFTPLRPNSTFNTPGPEFHRPTFPPRSMTPSNADAEPSGGGSRWAMSEAQLVRDLYRSRN
ncbi:hypothetical protein DENSPDRAFT_831212 [Dentipellis sp. KUC8613]|nr:hypothetical protein DENSPDRAFT_831212 [Dentipellis sp. KUC8613]